MESIHASVVIIRLAVVQGVKLDENIQDVPGTQIIRKAPCCRCDSIDGRAGRTMTEACCVGEQWALRVLAMWSQVCMSCNGIDECQTKSEYVCLGFTGWSLKSIASCIM